MPPVSEENLINVLGVLISDVDDLCSLSDLELLVLNQVDQLQPLLGADDLVPLLAPVGLLESGVKWLGNFMCLRCLPLNFFTVAALRLGSDRPQQLGSRTQYLHCLLAEVLVARDALTGNGDLGNELMLQRCAKLWGKRNQHLWDGSLRGRTAHHKFWQILVKN